MKKIFTLLFCAMLLSAFSAKSQETTGKSQTVTVYIQNADNKDIADSFKTELIKDNDNNYTFEDFFNSYDPLKFSFEIPDVDEESPIKFDGVSDTAKNPYLKDADGANLICNAWGLDGVKDWTSIYRPYINVIGCYVYHLDKEEYGYDYYGSIKLRGYLKYDPETKEYSERMGDWIYLNFYFNDPDPIVLPETTGEKVSCYPYNYTTEWVKIGYGFYSTITKDEDNVYCMRPFFGSRYPIYFTVGEFSEPDEDNCAYADITFVKNIKVDSGFVYLMNPNDTYMECSYIDNEDKIMKVDYPYATNDGSSYVTRYLDYEEKGYSQYEGTMCLGGFDTPNDDWYEEYFYIDFLADDLSSSTGSGDKVESIISNDNAPAVFYNLNGQRVEKPSNGIFIKKQGNKVEKIAIL